MILRSLKKEKMQNFYIVPIVDANRCGIWVAHVLNLVPKFEVYYSNNQTDIRLFKEAGIKVIEPGLVDRGHLAGVKIRKMMLESKAWKKHVPSAVVEVIEEIDGISRLRAVSYSKNNSMIHNLNDSNTRHNNTHH
jgi:nicotinamide-nucleotide adenylyltransferase